MSDAGKLLYGPEGKLVHHPESGALLFVPVVWAPSAFQVSRKCGLLGGADHVSKPGSLDYAEYLSDLYPDLIDGIYDATWVSHSTTIIDSRSNWFYIGSDDTTRAFGFGSLRGWLVPSAFRGQFVHRARFSLMKPVSNALVEPSRVSLFSTENSSHGLTGMADVDTKPYKLVDGVEGDYEYVLDPAIELGEYFWAVIRLDDWTHPGPDSAAFPVAVQVHGFSFTLSNSA